MGLSKFIKKSTTSKSLIDLMKDELGSDDKKPPLLNGEYVRASSMARVCAREEVICALENFYRKDTVKPDLDLTFSLGHGIHYAMQNHILPKIGVLLGYWRCLECGHLNKGEGDKLERSVIKRPDICQGCNKHTEKLYEELYFKNEKYKIHGHPDGFLQIPGVPGLGVLEVKSISQHTAWKVADTPDIGHVIQTHVYLWLTGLQWIGFVYWDKGTFGLRGLTVHKVERDEETINMIKSVLKSIWNGIDSEILPERICAKKSCDRAKECEVSEICFNR